jgi:selenium-binding protein 1
VPRGADGNDGPGGIALLDHSTFDVLRAWETDRGPQFLGTTSGGT